MNTLHFIKKIVLYVTYSMGFLNGIPHAQVMSSLHIVNNLLLICAVVWRDVLKKKKSKTYCDAPKSDK
jgi:hypothetical protein